MDAASHIFQCGLTVHGLARTNIFFHGLQRAQLLEKTTMALACLDPGMELFIVFIFADHLTTEVADDEPRYYGLLVHNLSSIYCL